MTAPAPVPIREFRIGARTTDVFGRVLCSARDHHFIVDGPLYNNCPGEELTPPEVFLTAVASCGVELIQVIAKEQGIAVGAVEIGVYGQVDRAKQPRTDITLFNKVHLTITVHGTDRNTASQLVQAFQRRCPIYGTMAASVLEMKTDVGVA